FFQAEDGIRDGHVTGVQTGALPILELSLEREALLSSLRVLTAEQQEVVTLRFFGGLSPREIGELMDKREGSIRALQFRAIETLRRHLAATGALTETSQVQPELDRAAAAMAAGSPDRAQSTGA